MWGRVAKMIQVTRRVFERCLHAMRSRALWRDLVPLVVVAAFSPWLYLTLKNYTHASLWRDINMFNYAGWCLLHGERIYDTIATPDGPFVYLLHAGMVLFVSGTHDRAFRMLDVAMQGGGAALMGALLVPRETRRVWLRRAVWAAVVSALWMSRAVQEDFYASMQRENYYVLFGSLGMCLVYASAGRSKGLARLMIASGSLLAGWMMFGKHTGVLYVGLVGLVAWLSPRDAEQTRRWRLAWVGAGVLASIITMLGLVALRGSLRGFWEWYFEFPFELYRYWLPVKPEQVLVHGDRAVWLTPSIVVLLAGSTAVAVRALPARSIAFALAPCLHFAAALAQKKGWAYQYAPVPLSTVLFYGLALIAAWVSPGESDDWTPLRSAAVVAITAFVALHTVDDLQHAVWLQEGQKHDKDDEVLEAREGAQYLSEHTEAGQRVFYYGNDPSVLFIAQRPPAIPTETVLMLNFDNVLANHSEDTGPPESARPAMLALQSRIQSDACRRITTHEPIAMVFTDRAAAAGSDGVRDITTFCPALGPMLEHDYRLARTVKRLRIFERNDHP